MSNLENTIASLSLWTRSYKHKGQPPLNRQKFGVNGVMNSNGWIVIVNSDWIVNFFFLSPKRGESIVELKFFVFLLVQILSGEAWQGQSIVKHESMTKAKHDMMKIPSFSFWRTLKWALLEAWGWDHSYQLSGISLLEAWDNIFEYCNHFGRCVG